MTHQNFIIKNLQISSKIALDNFEKVKTIEKNIDNNQVLTQTDLEIGKYLVDQIKKVYPNHNIIDEESGVINKKSNLTWVVDPIDGTSNFANGIPMYGIMLGLLEKDVPILGGVALPAFGELYFAEKNKGSFRNNKRIKVTSNINLLKSLVTYAIDAYQKNPELTYKESRLIADIVLNIRNLRSSNSCFDLMMVASGKYGAWLNRTSKIWDNVAPQIIITEAGGIYTDFIGNPIDYSDPLTKVEKNFTVCASAPSLYKSLQDIIRQHNFKN